MPIYEYQCRECSHRLEKLQKLSDVPLTKCPECGRESLTKLVSAAGFRLKGGGWYETDFKKDGKRNLVGDDSSSKSDGGGSSSDSGAKESGKKDAGKADPGTSGSGKKEPARSSGDSSPSSKPSVGSTTSTSSAA